MTCFSSRPIWTFVATVVFVAGSACASDPPLAPTGTGGGETDSGTTSTGCSSTTSGGSGGAGAVPGIDACVLTSLHVCQNDFCHGAKSPSMDLMLTDDVLVGSAIKLLIDKPNVGKPGVTESTDPAGCPPAFAKIIDSSNPEKSLIYTKVGRPQACGAPMPIIGTFVSTDRACVLRWIESAISVCGGGSDAGGG